MCEAMYLAGNMRTQRLGALPVEFAEPTRARTATTTAVQQAVAAACVATEKYVPLNFPKLPLATNVSGLWAQDWQTARMAGLPPIGNIPYSGAVSADEYLRIALLNSDWQKVYAWYSYQISSIQMTGR